VTSNSISLVSNMPTQESSLTIFTSPPDPPSAHVPDVVNTIISNKPSTHSPTGKNISSQSKLPNIAHPTSSGGVAHVSQLGRLVYILVDSSAVSSWCNYLASYDAFTIITSFLVLNVLLMGNLMLFYLCHRETQSHHTSERFHPTG
jgi:hypothetical protein